MPSIHKLVLTTLAICSLLLPQSVTSFAPPLSFGTLLRNLAGIHVASPEDIQAALKDPATTVLDVRGPQEIKDTGALFTRSITGRRHAWVNIPCSPFDTSTLRAVAHKEIESKNTPVLIYCASGKRATTAKKALDEMGYTKVMNIGGWNDVQAYSSS